MLVLNTESVSIDGDDEGGEVDLAPFVLSGQHTDADVLCSLCRLGNK